MDPESNETLQLWVRQQVRYIHDLIETAAEMALVSQRYGVLVITDAGLPVYVGVSSTVPYGQIHYQQAHVTPREGLT